MNLHINITTHIIFTRLGAPVRMFLGKGAPVTISQGPGALVRSSKGVGAAVRISKGRACVRRRAPGSRPFCPVPAAILFLVFLQISI